MSLTATSASREGRPHLCQATKDLGEPCQGAMLPEPALLHLPRSGQPVQGACCILTDKPAAESRQAGAFTGPVVLQGLAGLHGPEAQHIGQGPSLGAFPAACLLLAGQRAESRQHGATMLG
jgi:hypothetical protein